MAHSLNAPDPQFQSNGVSISLMHFILALIITLPLLASNAQAGGKYDGEWKNDSQHGYGIYTLPNGEKYDGEWKDGNFNGYGIYTFLDGTSKEGEWKDDVLRKIK